MPESTSPEGGSNEDVDGVCPDGMDSRVSVGEFSLVTSELGGIKGEVGSS